jgi:NAD(P)-dependent dehydrogenase (short-subunit alcohol dehydrogenase family)
MKLTADRGGGPSGCGLAVVVGLLGAAAVVTIVVLQHNALVGEMVRESFAATLDRARYAEPLDNPVLRLAVLRLDTERPEAELTAIAEALDRTIEDGLVEHRESIVLLRLLLRLLTPTPAPPSARNR